MNTEFSVSQIRDFVKKDYPSVAARMTKSLLLHYDKINESTVPPSTPPQLTEAYVWVKASERLPAKGYSFDDFGGFPIRWEFDFRDIIAIGYLSEDEKGIVNGNSKKVQIDESLEWLEKVSLPSTQSTAEQKLKVAEVTEEQIDDFVTSLMKENPVKFIQYCLVVIARDIYKSNADNFSFSQECDIQKGKRVKVEITGTITPLNTIKER